MVPNIEEDYILLLGIVINIWKIILLGSTTKKRYSTAGRQWQLASALLSAMVPSRVQPVGRSASAAVLRRVVGCMGFYRMM